MTNDNSPDGRLDDAIDRAVREMMQVDPRPGLRRRVLARLERSAHGPGLRAAPDTWLRRFRGSFFLLPAAAVIAMVLAIVIPAVRPSAPDVKSAPPAQTASGHHESSRPRQRFPRPGRLPRNRLVRPCPRRRALRSSASGVIGSPPRACNLPSSTRERFPRSPRRTSQPGFARIVMTPLVEVSEIRIRPIEIQAITLPALSPPR